MGLKSRGGSTPGLHTALASFLLGGCLFLLFANVWFLVPRRTEVETFEEDPWMDDADMRRQVLEQGGWAAEGGTPPAGMLQTRRRDSTLVVYVYNAADEEQQRNFAFFLRYGITQGAATFRIVITKGPGVLDFPRLPSLPANAHYLRTEVCTGMWGAIDAVMRALPIADNNFFVVIDSSVRGPFLPSYASAGGALHWTEAFTHKLTGRVKMVGSVISCEGAPAGGDASGEWRGNPYVLPYAWATDSEGWRVLAATPGLFRCHASLWDARYHSDAGASLAILRAGYTLDCLMTRYQGVDWTSPSSWHCNQRVRPDLEMHYDGISIAPYETVFVPVSGGTASHRWSFIQAAARYEAWMDSQLRPPDKRPGVHSNAWISDHWTAKSERLTYMNSRGPACFDFGYYRKHNPDLQAHGSDPLALWEHFVLLGQFQGRAHHFSCPLSIGNSYRVAYVLARGPRCFDYKYYAEQHPDLARAGMHTPQQLFDHFAEFGQFEQRRIRFTCADTVLGLTRGFDSGRVAAGGAASAAELAQRRAMAEASSAEQREVLLTGEGDAEDAVQQALKGAMVAEAAKNAFKSGKRT